MQEKTIRRISKRMSFVLRHDPGSAGLTPDSAGWVEIQDLLAGLAATGQRLDRRTLELVVEKNDKKRFAIEGDRIRAQQGHSFEIDLDLPPQAPPALLYHGTATRNLDAILRDGLQRRNRHHVHLSADTATAVKVGSRHGKPVVLAIDSAAMADDGQVFFKSGNGVWLTEAVPARFIGVAPWDSGFAR